MELVVSWTSMVVTLFLVSNMIDVIVAIQPFIAFFCMLMLFMNMTNALMAMVCMWLKDLLFNHG
jgi:hypothetical protein